MTIDQPLLEVRDLRVSFRIDKKNSFEAVKGISFSLPKNATVALVGESGSGKSVSSLAVMGLLPQDTTLIHEGSSIRFDGNELLGQPLEARRKLCGKDIAMIFQEPMSSLNPVFTVGFQIGEVLRINARRAPARSSCWKRSASPTRPTRSTPTRARCRAASSSA
jgi:peptide/nickel transport system ATP-binding protein